jgi:predicted HTH transcriptional regulator
MKNSNPFNLIEKNIVMLIEEDCYITNKELSGYINKSERQIKRYLADLVNGGILESKIKYLSYSNGTKILSIRTLKVCNIKK